MGGCLTCRTLSYRNKSATLTLQQVTQATTVAFVSEEVTVPRGEMGVGYPVPLSDCTCDTLTSEVRKEFTDASPLNIHLRWKPLLSAWMETLNHYDPRLGLHQESISLDIDQQEEQYMLRKKRRSEGIVTESTDDSGDRSGHHESNLEIAGAESGGSNPATYTLTLADLFAERKRPREREFNIEKETIQENVFVPLMEHLKATYTSSRKSMQ